MYNLVIKNGIQYLILKLANYIKYYTIDFSCSYCKYETLANRNNFVQMKEKIVLPPIEIPISIYQLELSIFGISIECIIVMYLRILLMS